jgi:helicase required for RNAi-mediated heterochromatin assembly 1
VKLDRDIRRPAYVENQPLMDLNSLVRPDIKETGVGEQCPMSHDTSLDNVDVMKPFPDIPQSGMDLSQMAACQNMLTRSIAIVQGPPGTGKTYTSISALRVMLANMAPGDPPIIIAAQTNHALDQLLKHIACFEERFLRLGSRCDKENVDIVKRTIFELRSSCTDLPNSSRGLRVAYHGLETRKEKIEFDLAPIMTGHLLTAETLLQIGVITQPQFDSLEEAGWVTAEDSELPETRITECKLHEIFPRCVQLSQSA